MALIEQKLINHTGFTRTKIAAAVDIAEYLGVDSAGAICGAAAYPIGTIYKATSTGDEVVVVPDYEYGQCISGAAFTAGDLLSFDANGKAIVAPGTGTYVFGVAQATATGADEQIEYLKVPVYYL